MTGPVSLRMHITRCKLFAAPPAKSNSRRINNPRGKSIPRPQGSCKTPSRHQSALPTLPTSSCDNTLTMRRSIDEWSVPSRENELLNNSVKCCRRHYSVRHARRTSGDPVSLSPSAGSCPVPLWPFVPASPTFASCSCPYPSCRLCRPLCRSFLSAVYRSETPTVLYDPPEKYNSCARESPNAQLEN
jgi:hypothetical protein